jgi:curved DNA-binding protein CbpA
LPDEPKIPKLTGDKSGTPLRLSASEGFVLSRIDGKANEAQLAGLTGLHESQIRATLEKLVSLRVITLEARETPIAQATPVPQVPERSDEPAQGALPGAPGADAPAALAKRVEAAMAAVARDAPELAEEVDLAAALRLRILGTISVLESLDYYELLTVERTADKKGVKRSDFELASIFHPDRYFRKRLGSFKTKMEAIFGRVTQAHDTLTNKDQRAEYDTYLADLDRTRAIEDVLRSADEEARRAEQDLQQAVARSSYPGASPDGNSGRPSPIPSSGSSAQARPVSGGPPKPSKTPPPSGLTQPPAKISGFYSAIGTTPGTPGVPSGAPLGSPVITDQARRDVLAMRLLGNRAPGRGVSSPPPPRGDGGEMLKRRYEERVALARKAQAEKYVALAKEAEAKNDILGAATTYKVAMSFLQEGHPALATAQAVIAKADATLSETYLRQALYEERAEHWPDAARSWQRVARGRPDDARAHERAANAMTRAKSDLHAAAELAKRAIQIEPRNAEYKITLATVFIEAGLSLNARRELEAAAQLSPRNATIQALLKRVNKAG